MYNKLQLAVVGNIESLTGWLNCSNLIDTHRQWVRHAFVGFAV